MIKGIKSHISKNVVVIFCILLAITINLIFTFGKGPILTSDSQFYSEGADKLVSLGFNIPHYLAISDSSISDIFYLFFILLIAVLKVLLGQNWAWGLIGFNLFFSSLAIICLYKLLQNYTKSTFTILVGFILILLAQDFRLWIGYVLTDSIFSSLVFIILFLAVTTIKPIKNISPISIIGFILLVLLTIFIRPTFIPLFGSVVLYFLWVYILGRAKVKQRHTHRLLYLLLILSVIFCIFGFAYLVHSALIGQPKFASNTFNIYVEMFHEGWIIHDRPELSYKTPTIYFDVVAIIFKRLAFFFVFINNTFSRLHNLINALFFIPVYSLTLVAVTDFFKRDFEGNTVRNNIFIFCSLTIICFTVFQSFTLIDYDWRYRLPIILPLITLACLGADFLFSHFKRGSASS